MALTRRAFLAAAAAVACHRPDVGDRGAAYLWSRQAEDGGFHGEVYGFFRGGASLSGLCLLALRPTDDRPRAARALAFLRERAPAADPTDYPTYATSLALSAAAVWGDPRGFGAHREFLLAQQRLAGFEEGPAFGGFGMGSVAPPEPPHAGHVDLSMTRAALEAIAATGGGPALAAGRRFALACRDEDGGFTYSYEPGVNKGPDARTGYGTATCDGILALLAAADPADAPVVDAAVARLRATFRPDANPGLGGGFADYGPAMRFYWRAGVARVFQSQGGPPGWQVAIRDALAAEQRPDGSWSNEANVQKEDEPLIATALAAIAWNASR
jgi:hypothetical protein